MDEGVPHRPARRIVSLVPSLTDTLIRLGRGDRLAGRTAWCPDPGGVPVVGGTKNPDVGKIRRLAPDLVLAVKEENTPEAVAGLRKAGIPVAVYDPERADDAPRLARALGGIVEAEAEAEAMAATIEAALAGAREGAARRPAIPGVYLVWKRPWMAAGPRTYIGDLLAACGLAFPLPDRGPRYPEVTPGEVARAGARLVLLPSEPYPFTGRDGEEFRREAGLEPKGPVVLLPCRGDLVGWYPGRTAAALDHLAAILDGR